MKPEHKENNNTEEKKIKNSNFIDAWKNAINGIIYATTTQGNIKKQLIIAVAVVIISLFFNLNKAEFLIFLFTIILIIFAEMVNTAIETVVDLYTDLYHPKAKMIHPGCRAAWRVPATANQAIRVHHLPRLPHSFFRHRAKPVLLQFARAPGLPAPDCSIG